MKFAILGDLHGCIINLKRIQRELKKCQAIFLTGDITGTISYPLVIKSILKSKKISRERYTELVYSDYLEKFTTFQIKTARKIFKILKKLKIPVFFTHGNSDTEEARKFFEKISKQEQNFFYVGNSLEISKNLKVIGYGFCSPAEYRTPLQTPGEREKDIIKSDLHLLEKQFLDAPTIDKEIIIGLFHEPPLETKLDYLPQKLSYGGSELIKEHISKIPYDFIFTGHIHESQNVDQIGSAVAINPGALVDRNYAFLELRDSKVSFQKLRIPLSFKEMIYRTRTVFE